MQLSFDEDLVEEAVFLCASRRWKTTPALQIQRFHRGREKLYAILDPDERNAAFFSLHLEWFREWGLDASLVNVLREFPVIPTKLEILAFRRARGQSEEGAELYVKSGSGRHGVLAVRSARFESDSALADFLRHELMHLHDMVDPQFGYSRRLPVSNAGQQRLVRERYRLVWDVTIDGRLANTGRLPAQRRELRWAEFNRGFPFWPEEKRGRVFDSLWTEASPRHDQLLSVATDPRDLQAAHKPQPGAACPLCGFTTFNWTDVTQLDAPMLQAIRDDFPGWTPEEGACDRCAEIYQSLRNLPSAGLPVER